VEDLGVTAGSVQRFILSNVSESLGGMSRAHCEGVILLEDGVEVRVKILLDTGAISANYVSANVLSKIRHSVSIKKKKGGARLADAKTVLDSSESALLNLKIFGDDSTETFSGYFDSIDIADGNIIIGLPSILGCLWSFSKTLWQNRIDMESMSEQNECAYNQLAGVDELLRPWDNCSLTEAPEEEEVDSPVQFEHAINFLNMSREQATQEFFDMFDEHIESEFARTTDIKNLLKTKGLRVFVPHNWEGIKGIEPLKLKFKDTLPAKLKPRARPINPRLFETAYKEFTRLKTYMYVESRSEHASCLVVAPKATKPFIRFCGDYVEVNKHICTGHYTIPRVKHELDRIIDYSFYCDMDMTTAFHQITLEDDTAEVLSIQTPWGQYQPKFMPEGIGPGSGVLQETVRKLFADFEWAICIFDNILILATSHQDGYEKLELFFDRCLKHNVVLKFAKSWLGFRQVNFFGYVCKHKSYQLTDDRKKAICDMPFPEAGPKQQSKMRSVLGSGVFFAPFVKNYTDHVNHLTDLTKDNFDRNEASWKYDYRAEFASYKEALQAACAIYFPDYELPWIIRCDASEIGVGGVLVQVAEPNEEQIIALISKKFSDPATRWTTIEQEAFAIYYVVKKLAYYLVGKEFVVETDHNNLRWMEQSEVPKIIRQRIYLQSFAFSIRHIAGKLNVLPDTLSRLFVMYDNFDPFGENESTEYLQLCSVFGADNTIADTNIDSKIDSVGESSETIMTTQVKMLSDVHNQRKGHWGAKETWRRLNKYFPGHGISYAQVAEFVDMCNNCQKTRREFTYGLRPVIRNLKPPHARSVCGIDALEVTPHGANGQTHINVIVNLYTKQAYLYPVAGVTAEHLVNTVWSYWCNFGHTDMIISDLGPDLNSKLFDGLVTLMGMTHKFSIANKHANGCERQLKEVSRHLRAICYDDRIKDIYDDPNTIPSVQYILNTLESSETGYFTPFELTFGSQDKVYSNLLSNKDVEPSHALLKNLNENLKVIRQVSREYQQTLVESREGKLDQIKQNKYQPGDLVMFDKGSKVHPKMSTRYKGPHEVVNQYKNDVSCRNLITGAILEYSVEDLEPFFGTKDEAIESSLRDQDQYFVECILSYTGDCNTRSKMCFEVKYADGDIVNLPWSMDLQCEAYYNFCESRPYLRHLAMDTKIGTKFKSDKAKLDIISVNVGDIVYIDLRFFGDYWYEAMELPNFQSTSYVLEFKYTHYFHKSSKKKISGIFTLIADKYSLNSYQVYAWGSVKQFDATSMVLIDKSWIKRYPKLVG
jgi:hypothetical protein